MTDHMKAWEIISPGNIEQQLKLNNVPRPLEQSLRPGQILIQVAAATINPADYKSPEMGFVTRVVLSYPNGAAMDLSGRVVGAAASVADVKIGDHVVARMDPFKVPGALSEYVIASKGDYAPLLKSVDLDQAAGLGTAGLTAYQTIKPYVKPGDKIFINGGTGGVGMYAIQVAKLLGCHVTVTCSTGKVALCKDLGADQVIDYKTNNVVESLSRAGKVYAHAIDTVGTSPRHLHASSSKFLLPDAKFVLVAGAMTWDSFKQTTSALILPALLGGGKNKAVIYLTYQSGEDLLQLVKWLNEGRLRTVVDSVWEFDSAVAAFKRLKTGSTTGKVVIRVGSNISATTR
ncbi:hypothetical protein MY10362_009897 [Beauveria mimosiformis]